MPYTPDPQADARNTVRSLGDVVVGKRVVRVTSTGASGATSFASQTNAVTLDCSKGDIFTNTPTEATTITAINMAPGQRITIIFLTSGGSSFVTTFGTGFVSTGTLASGTVTGKYFIVEFVSDGTNLYESSRTTAM